MEPYGGAALLEETHYLGVVYRLSSLPGQFLSFSCDECDQPSLGTCHHGVRLLPCRHTTMDSYPSGTTSQAKLFLLCIVLGHGAYQSHRKVTSAGE